jgi:hypothetical protein
MSTIVGIIIAIVIVLVIIILCNDGTYCLHSRCLEIGEESGQESGQVGMVWPGQWRERVPPFNQRTVGHPLYPFPLSDTFLPPPLSMPVAPIRSRTFCPPLDPRFMTPFGDPSMPPHGVDGDSCMSEGENYHDYAARVVRDVGY